VTRLLLGIGAFTPTITLLFLAVAPPGDENTDLVSYYRPLALNLLDGRGLVVEDERALLWQPPGFPDLVRPVMVPATYRTPGYSLLLVPVYAVMRILPISEVTALRAFTVTWTVLTGMIMCALACAIWRSRRAALLVGLLWITYPFALWLTEQNNTETPFLTVFYGALLLLFTTILRGGRAYRRYFAVGVLFGIAALIRPSAFGVVAAAAVAVVVLSVDQALRARLACVALVLAGNLVVLLPWQVWLFQQSGQLTLLAGNAGVHNLRLGMTSTLANSRGDLFVTDDVRALKWKLVERREEIDSTWDYARVLVDEFRAQPIAMTRWTLLRFAQSWYSTASGSYQELILLIQIPYLVLIGCATWRGWRRGADARRWTIVLWAFGLYFWVTSSATYSLLRYLIPGVGVWLLLLPALLPRITPRRASDAPGTITTKSAAA